MCHLSNAAITPLVAQLIMHQDKRTGLVFNSAVLCIFHSMQAPSLRSACVVSRVCDCVGYKNLLLVAHLILRVRCSSSTVSLPPSMHATGPTSMSSPPHLLFEGLGPRASTTCFCRWWSGGRPSWLPVWLHCLLLVPRVRRLVAPRRGRTASGDFP